MRLNQKDMQKIFKNKKILVLASQKNTVGVVLPIGKSLKSLGGTVKFITYNKGRHRGTDAFSFYSTKPDAIIKDLTSLPNVFSAFSPDIIITGSGGAKDSDASFEQIAIKLARAWKIPTLSILDFWGNYSSKFGGLSSDSTKRFFDRFKYLPDLVCVFDRNSYEKLREYGIPKEKIRITGNPEFEDMHRKIKKFSNSLREMKDEFLESLDLDSHALTFLLLFQEISKEFGPNLGYDEQIFLEESLKAINEIAEEYLPPVNVIIRLDKDEALPSLLASLKRSRTNIGDLKNLILALDRDEDDFLAFYSADVVIGMTTPLLTKARIYEKPAISFQPGLQTYDPLPTNSLGITVLCENYEMLLSTLRMAIEGTLPLEKIPLLEGSIERVLEGVAYLLTKNSEPNNPASKNKLI